MVECRRNVARAGISAKPPRVEALSKRGKDCKMPAKPALDALEDQMRSIGHFIGGREVKGTSGRTADVFEP
ncbi:MAG: hypothetical protein ACRECG_12435, partial [Bradyrhizobium sp.]